NQGHRDSASWSAWSRSLRITVLRRGFEPKRPKSAAIGPRDRGSWPNEQPADSDRYLKRSRFPAAFAWRDPDSNRGHHDFQSCALPTELSRRNGRSYLLSGPAGRPRRRAAARLAVFPGFEVGQRVDRVTAAGLPASHPHLEVQVRGRGVARLARLAERLPRRYGLPGAHRERVCLAVREHEVQTHARVLHGVVAGTARLVAGGFDRPSHRGQHGRAFGREHVLALVDM